MGPSPQPEFQKRGKGLKLKRILLYILIAVVLILGSSSLYLHINYPTAYPWVSAGDYLYSLTTPRVNMNKDIVGFIPYWNLDNSKYIRFNLLSEVIFFSLSSDDKGNVVKVVNGQTDPGWRWWRSSTIQNIVAKTQIAGGKFAVTIAMQKNDSIKSFLDNKSSQQNLISQLLDLISKNNLNGLNVDFEYDGDPGSKYQAEFTDFATLLTSTFHTRSPKTELSVDVFPLSVEKPRLYDVSKLSALFDKVIVMSYDYYSLSSDQAGPVAPMRGYIPNDPNSYIFDIATTYSDYLKVAPKDKIIMGIPYYGYDWPVQDGKTPLSPVLPQNDQNGYPAVLSFGRMKTDTDLKPQNCQWDNQAQEPWCYYTDSQNISHQVWYEDERSIGVKEQFLKDNGLAGMAIWTLGYDWDYPQLWNLITQNFKAQ